MLRAASTPVRVVLADDSSSFRLLMQLTLEDHAAFSIVGTAGDGLEAVRVVEREQPDVVLLDIAMPRMDGLEAIPAIREAAPHVKIAVLSGYSADRMGAVATAAGAELFLEKAAPDDEVVAALLQLCGRTEQPAPQVARAGPEPSRSTSGSGDDYVDLLLDALEEGVLVTDAAGVIQSANFSATQLFGYATSVLVGRHVSKLGISDGSGDPSEDPISAALALGRPVSAVDVSVDRPDGTSATLLASVRPMRKFAGAEPHAAVASFVDVSRRREAEEAARESAQRFRSALDTMLDAVALYTAIRDGDGEIVDFFIHHANPAIEDVTGQHSRNLIGQQLLHLFPALRGSPMFASYVSVVATGKPFSVDSLDYRPYDDGHLNRGAYRVQACRMGDGLVVTWRLVGRRSTDSPVPLDPPQ